MIPQIFIDELLSRVDIVDVVEQFVPLKRSGVNLSACCPFHEEKTPSFTVSQQKQFYHCFGCGAHGSAISFLMEQQGLGFIDAVENLAARAGIAVPRDQRKDNDEQRKDSQEYFLSTSRAASHYKRCLKDAPGAINYLKARGIEGSVAAKFLVGYASENWQELKNEFTDYDDSTALLEAGLVNEKDGRRYDRFRDRIIFPIRDSRGRVIAFGGRVIDKGEPKYLNSPETPFFHKGKEVYGFWESRHSIRKEQRVLVVEGYMDVVALHQSGITYSVATLGTAVTEFQVARLLKQCSDLIFCFDGDLAGRKAALRALESSLGQVQDGSKVSFLFLPDGEDPDSFVRAQGREIFERNIAEAVPMSDFLINDLIRQSGNLDSVEGKSRLASLFKPVVARVNAPMIRKLLIEKVSALTGLVAFDLGDVPQVRTSQSFRRAPNVQGPERSRATSAPSVLKHLIQMLLVFPELARNADSAHLLNVRPSLQQRFAASEFDLLSELLELAAKQLNQSQIIARFRGSVFDEAVLKASSLAHTRYQQGSIDFNLVKEEYAQAWDQLNRLTRLNLQKELLSNRTISSLTDEDKARYRSLTQSQTDPNSD